jgi:broad specificity phosphatase PhoE
MTSALDLVTDRRESGVGTCQVYVVRHGTTILNVQNRYRGRRDVPLDAQGYQDAVDAARALSGVGLDAVYAAPLRRTIATAQIIGDEARLPDLRVLYNLNNVDYGAWEGMTAAEARAFDPREFDRYTSSPSTAVCPAGERLSDAQQRILEALRLIGDRHAGEVVAAVTHAVMVRLAVAALRGTDDATWRIPVGRGSLTRFDINDGVISVAALPAGDDVD